MISMHNISSAGHALQYFSKDNYYTKEDGLSESEWYGKGAKFLGLTGQIEQKAFFDTLDGKFVGQELGKLMSYFIKLLQGIFLQKGNCEPLFFT